MNDYMIYFIAWLLGSIILAGGLSLLWPDRDR
jgi:hypothetical protein